MRRLLRHSLKLSLFVALASISVPGSAWARSQNGHRLQRGIKLNLQKARIYAKAMVMHPRRSLQTINKAERVLGRKCSLGEKISVIAAHNYGKGIRVSGQKVLWKKGVILKKARFLSSMKRSERRSLMKNKVVGTSEDKTKASADGKPAKRPLSPLEREMYRDILRLALSQRGSTNFASSAANTILSGADSMRNLWGL